MPFFSHQAVPDIFQANPNRYSALAQFIQTVMRGESAFSPGERELIAAYVSGLNACQYCYGSHQAIATDLGIDPQLLEAVLQDLATAPIDARLRPVLALVQKLTLTPGKVTQADIDAVTQAGWQARAIQDAIEVCALFSLMNRIVDGYGLETPASQQLTAIAKGINTHGYEAPLTMKKG
ncbi:MAG: peroxidase-related enzyme [Cyanothece sp. SIO1E1]|nr:peroxidase-related enzyme [Cyanothece sp. SIO1E1]